MAEVLLVNPRSRRRRRKGKAKTRARRRRSIQITARANPVRRRRRRSRARAYRLRGYRRNPAGIGSFVRNTLVPSGVGAGGALLVDVALGVVPLPAVLQSPLVKPLVKGVAAVGIGLLAGMLTSRRVAEQIAAGALTVVMYDSAKQLVQRIAPALPLGMTDEYPELSYVNAGQVVDGVGGYIEDHSMSGGDGLTDELTDSIGEYVEGVGEYVETY